MDKKDAAWVLYEKGYTQKNIAQILKVSEQTIVTWKKEKDWDKKLADRKELYESNADKILKLIAYQLRALERMTSEWEETGSKQLIGKGEIDALSKLYSTIKTKETSWAQTIETIKLFMEYLQQQNIDLAKKVADFADMFLNDIRG